MTVDVVVVMAVVVTRMPLIGFRRQPAVDVGDFAIGVVEAAAEQRLRRCFVLRRIEDRRRRIERMQTRQQDLIRIAALGRVEQVSLGQDDPVGDGNLLDRLQVLVERRRAVDGVDHRDDAVEPVAHRQVGMRHRGLQHRRRVGEPGRLQHHAAEAGAAVVEVAQKLLQRVDQVATKRTTQTTALKQDDTVANLPNQQVVEADFAEFIDDDGGLGQGRVTDQAVEQRGFAGAEEAGQDREGKRFGRPGSARGGAHHRVCEVC